MPSALDLIKRPSIAKTVDWARTLHLLGIAELDQPAVLRTLPAFLKHRADAELVHHELRQVSRARPAAA